MRRSRASARTQTHARTYIRAGINAQTRAHTQVESKNRRLHGLMDGWLASMKEALAVAWSPSDLLHHHIQLILILEL